jgi:heme oxygenase
MRLNFMGEPLHLLARLGRETLPHHADADADVDRYLFGSMTRAADYRTYLTRIYGFLLPFESALAQTPGLDLVIDVSMRAKAVYVLQDMLSLGMTMHEVAELPQTMSVPAFRGPAAALGWMYVAERPMLASAVIRRHLATRLPAEMLTSAAYLSCYSGLVGTMWRQLGEAMDRLAFAGGIADRIVDAAHEAFRAQHRWRTQDLQRAALAV